MPIQTQCDHCGHPYVARDELAGRRVRCRQCGLVFALTSPDNQVFLAELDDNSGDAIQNSDLSADDTAADFLSPPPEPASPYPRRDQSETRAMPAVTTVQSNMAGGSDKSVMQRPEVDPGEFDFASDVSVSTGMRPSFAFNFPFAAELDVWLPRIILLLMIFWAGYQAWTWRPGPENPLFGITVQMPAWSGAVPLALLLIVFFAAWWPLYRGANRKASSALKFALPEGTRMRAAAMASVPFAMGVAFWFGGESTVTAAVGMILGTGLALMAGWFLLRLQDNELPFVAIALSVASVIATVLTCVLLVCFNMALGETLRAMHKTDLFAASPVGPGMAWGISAPKTPQVITPKATPALIPAPVSVKNSAGVLPPIPPAIGVRPDLGLPLSPETLPTVAVPAPGDPLPDKTPPKHRPDAGEVAIAVPDVVPVPNTDNNTGDAVPTKPDATVTANAAPRVLGTNNEVIREARHLGIVDAQQMVYPLTSAERVASISVLRNGRGQYLAELYNTRTMERLSTISLQRTTDVPSYALSPDGDLLARFSKGLISEIQVYSFSKGKLIQRVALDDRTVQARLLGFINKTTLLIEFRGGGGLGGASYALRTQELAPPSREKTATFVETPSPIVSVYADSRHDEAKVAGVVAASASGPAAVRIFNLANPGLKQLIVIPDRIDPAVVGNPSGVAFSFDGRQVAVSYESDGQIVVAVFGLVEGRLLATHAYSDGSAAEAPRSAVHPNNRFSALPARAGNPAAMGAVNTENRLVTLGADLWLYSGRMILGTGDGEDRVLGSLIEFSPQLQQKVMGPDVLQALVNKPTGTYLVQITLQLPKK